MTIRVLALILAVYGLIPTPTFAADPVVRECTSFLIPGQCKDSDRVPTQTRRTKKLGGEAVITTKIKIPQRNMNAENQCTPRVELSYFQRNDRIQVDASVEHDDCAKSAGRYTVRARTVGETGEPRTRDFVEQWSREDMETVSATHVYDMDGDTRVMWVRVQTRPNEACSCFTDPVDEPDSTAQADLAQPQ